MTIVSSISFLLFSSLFFCTEGSREGGKEGRREGGEFGCSPPRGGGGYGSKEGGGGREKEGERKRQRSIPRLLDPCCLGNVAQPLHRFLFLPSLLPSLALSRRACRAVPRLALLPSFLLLCLRRTVPNSTEQYASLSIFHVLLLPLPFLLYLNVAPTTSNRWMDARKGKEQYKKEKEDTSSLHHFLLLFNVQEG